MTERIIGRTDEAWSDELDSIAARMNRCRKEESPHVLSAIMHDLADFYQRTGWLTDAASTRKTALAVQGLTTLPHYYKKQNIFDRLRDKPQEQKKDYSDIIEQYRKDEK